MNTGSKLTLAGIALTLSAMALPAAAAPGFFAGADTTPFQVASRDGSEFQDEREARKAKKQTLKKDHRDERATERGREQESSGYGYGYERRTQTPLPAQADPRFDDRRHR